MSEELEVLKIVCQKLEDAQIPYMLTGSFAANFYAIPRMTRDIDIVIKMFHEDVEIFFKTFRDTFYIDKELIFDAINRQAMFNIIHNDTVFKIDFIICKDLSYRKNEFQRRRQVELGDSKIWIVSPEDLIISKLHWAKNSLSEMQLKDVKNLLKNIKNLDFDYLESWVKKLQIDPVYSMVKINE